MKVLIYCCGFNGFGQLKPAVDNFVDKLTILPIENTAEVAFSWSNLFVRTTVGEVFAFGQLEEKDGENIQLTFEADMDADNSTKTINHMSCSFFRKQALFVTELGECFLLGGDSKPLARKLNDFTRVECDDLDGDSIANRIVKVCCGGYTNLALSAELDKLYCIPSVVPLNGIKVQEIACGFDHNLLMTKRGEVFSWGAGSRGQLGLSNLDDVQSPTLVALPPVTHIAAGGWHCFVRTASNVLFSWGWNSHGQLGFPTAKDEKSENSVNVAAEPLRVPFTSDIPLTGLECGNKHTVLVLDHKRLWGCGWNGYGQLGKPPEESPSFERLTELDVPNGKIREVFAGGWNTGLLMEPENVEENKKET